jgi:hypothetical protein
MVYRSDLKRLFVVDGDASEIKVYDTASHLTRFGEYSRKATLLGTDSSTSVPPAEPHPFDKDRSVRFWEATKCGVQRGGVSSAPWRDQSLS